MGGDGCPQCLGVKGAKAAGQAGGKRAGLNRGLPPELGGLSAGEESGMPSVAVKCVDIRRNTGGEGGFLDCN